MTTVVSLHAKAMETFSKAEIARKNGRVTIAKDLYRVALTQGMLALERLRAVNPLVEPSWSAMHAWCATIALHAKKPLVARSLCETALKTPQHQDMREELEGILAEAKSR